MIQNTTVGKRNKAKVGQHRNTITELSMVTNFSVVAFHFPLRSYRSTTESSPTLRALCFRSNGLSQPPDRRLREKFPRFWPPGSRHPPPPPLLLPPPPPLPPPELPAAAIPQTLDALLDVSNNPESGSEAINSFVLKGNI